MPRPRRSQRRSLLPELPDERRLARRVDQPRAIG
jgi:hypothetical protein